MYSYIRNACRITFSLVSAIRTIIQTVQSHWQLTLFVPNETNANVKDGFHRISVEPPATGNSNLLKRKKKNRKRTKKLNSALDLKMRFNRLTAANAINLKLISNSESHL